MKENIDFSEDCPCGSGMTFGECHAPKVKSADCPKITMSTPLQVIPEPEPNTMTVLHLTDKEKTVVIRGPDVGLAMTCGKCGAHLVEGWYPSQIQEIAIICNGCGSYNLTSAKPDLEAVLRQL